MPHSKSFPRFARPARLEFINDKKLYKNLEAEIRREIARTVDLRLEAFSPRSWVETVRLNKCLSIAEASHRELERRLSYLRDLGMFVGPLWLLLAELAAEIQNYRRLIEVLGLLVPKDDANDAA